MRGASSHRDVEEVAAKSRDWAACNYLALQSVDSIPAMLEEEESFRHPYGSGFASFAAAI